MAVVVGLGNPGRRYRRTRHNVGFRVVEGLVARWRAEPQAVPGTARFRAWRAAPGGREVALLEPHTFMNASGEALLEWAGAVPSDPTEVLIVCDDIYLPVGRLRLRKSGSAGGHRGLESVEAALGTRDYPRLRIGVGAASSAADYREHVLAPPAANEEEVLEASLRRAEDAVECWLLDGIQRAMNRFNAKTTEEVKEE
jgi:PTH1 family peptidyl-tRNA hydrolase